MALSKTEVIRRFLKNKTLGHLYHPGLEVQVNVKKGLGEETKKGCYSDGVNVWYNFRIDNEKYAETKVNYDFDEHVESIGLTGWNYQTKQTEWVGFDFDSIIGHKEGLSEAQINEIVEKAKQLPFVTIRLSKSGQGVHLYVPTRLDNVDTRKQHIHCAKYILSQLSALLQFDFKTKVDTAGTILWIWHIRAKPNGFETIKEATDVFSNFPDGWENSFEVEKKQRQIVQDLRLTNLDHEHQQLINYLISKNHSWWNAELNMLVCHTAMLRQAHTDLNLKGVFFTNATGRDLPSDWNCFGFPISSGGWIIRRYGKPKEHPYWKVDKNDYLYCYFNRRPNLNSIAPIYGGKQNSGGQWVFDDSSRCNSVLQILALQPNITFPEWASTRQYFIKPIKEHKLAISFERTSVDPDSALGWIRRRTSWEQVVDVYEQERIIKPPDELIRHVVAEGEDAGWFINGSGNWIGYPTEKVKLAMISMGYKKNEIEDVLGQCILNPWVLVNQPFGSEYPGNRKWNKYSPQLLYTPREGPHPNWTKILNHLGEGMDLSDNAWCVANNVTIGGEYLLLWIASVFQFPFQPLPYLAIQGPQNSGKSIIYEALQLLVDKGIVRGESALTSSIIHNEELAGSIIAVIDEFNLAGHKGAYDRIKDWVTARTISIRAMFRKPFMFPNSTHWIQIANDPSYFPIQMGDTRITIIQVNKPRLEIPKIKLLELLMEEAPAFLHTILNIVIPAPVGRLRIPVIESGSKQDYAKTTLVEDFILQRMHKCNGAVVLFADFVKAFHGWLLEQGKNPVEWSNRKIAFSITENESMPVKGRYGGEGQIALGNFTFDNNLKSEDWKWVKVGERIVRQI